jgi:OOP family OmpA-OmpF porin
MKMSLLAGTAIVVASVASGAYAQVASWRPDSGWYGAIDFGGQKNLPFDASSIGASGAEEGFKIRTDIDWAGFIRFGYRINPYLRVELEGGYRAAPLQTANGFLTDHGADICAPGSTGDPTCGTPQGNNGAWTGMFNGLIDVFPHWRFSPFVGGGVGYVDMKTNIRGSLAGPGLATATPVDISQSQAAFAYQGIGGVSYHAAGNIDIDLTYRYVGSAKENIETNDLDPVAPGPYTGEYRNNSVTLGVRYTWGSPPPPHPPPPHPPPTPPPPPPPRRHLRRRLHLLPHSRRWSMTRATM